MSKAKEITKSDFQELKSKEGVYLIDFWATWCPPCKAMEPIINGLAEDEDMSKITFVKVDVDKEAELSGEFGVRSIPTFLLIKFKGDGSFDPETDILAKYIGAQDGVNFKIDLLNKIK